MDSFNRGTTEADTAAQADGMDRVRTQRARGRDSLFLVAKLRLGDEHGIREVRVRNLSEGGLMIELDKIAEVGTPVRMDLRGIGEIAGKVAWCTEGRIGIALDSPIDPKKARKPAGTILPTTIPFYAKAPTRI